MGTIDIPFCIDWVVYAVFFSWSIWLSWRIRLPKRDRDYLYWGSKLCFIISGTAGLVILYHWLAKREGLFEMTEPPD